MFQAGKGALEKRARGEGGVILSGGQGRPGQRGSGVGGLRGGEGYSARRNTGCPRRAASQEPLSPGDPGMLVTSGAGRAEP